ncbi:GtrA family protein [Desulfovermiculus halophilus]|jgi:putative flippase GtrA|uniref:GtrA family protein n=1 Tax=Desulfovermiculus halophilus TaxID=339722 RepID=UPI0006854B53|nr:GtrA family protein [Desulfovermiculus halophilus]
MKIVFLYLIFALISISINLITQWPFFHFFQGPWVIYAALAAGTLTGLLTKYALDKRWIFYYQPTSTQDNAAKFVLYSLMGVVTTAIFWGTETAFFFLFDFPGSQYVGGGIGLTIGYTTKYFLDKRFVFRTSTCTLQDGAATRL